MTCLPDQPMDAWRLFEEWYGIPNAATLGILLGIIVGALYIHTRSIVFLAVAGIYSLSLVGATFVADAYLAPQYEMAWYIIVVAIASGIVALVLKLIRE